MAVFFSAACLSCAAASPWYAPRGSVPFIISFESFIWSLIGISSLDSWHSRWKTSLIQREAFNRWSRSLYSLSHGFHPCQNSRTTSGMSFWIFLMALLISYHLEEHCGFLNCRHFCFCNKCWNEANLIFPRETVCSWFMNVNKPSYVEHLSASNFSQQQRWCNCRHSLWLQAFWLAELKLS